nr:MAG TPA: hypothetical protein [Caudoviricetes sp.]DAO62010.1 MAG TPA: hypothetical protein [Caudoviricetes sp.]
MLICFKSKITKSIRLSVIQRKVKIKWLMAHY